MSKHSSTYTIDVVADSADEAIIVAAEALPRGAEIISENADPVDDAVWRVTLRYSGGERRGNDPSA